MTRLLKAFLSGCGLAAVVYIALVLLASYHHPTMSPIDAHSNIPINIRSSIQRLLPPGSAAVKRLASTSSHTDSQSEKNGSGTKSKLPASVKRESSSEGNSQSVTDTATKSSSVNDTVKVLNATSRGAEAVGSAATNSSGQKYLIFVCDKRRSCGGWGDRQRGLVGTFLLALATGRKFGVIMTVPCNVTNFYIPNRVNWNIPESELKGKSTISLDDVNSKLRLTARLKTMDFNEVYPHDVVYVRNNAEYWLGLRASRLYSDRLPPWAKGSRANYFATAWRLLMKPSLSLETRLKEFLHSIDFHHRQHPLVCSHVRVGRSGTFKKDTVVRCNITTLPVLWDFVDRWVKNGSHVFLATDNWQVRNLTRKRFGDMMYDTGGQIMHVDQQARMPNACQGFESALLDQLVLTHCDVLITSHSIFSQRASYLRGRPDNLFSFLKGKIQRIYI